MIITDDVVIKFLKVFMHFHIFFQEPKRYLISLLYLKAQSLLKLEIGCRSLIQNSIYVLAHLMMQCFFSPL